MYESHFALSASPFQLNPDPAFYFDSRGHNNALAYLNFGVHQGEGFIVVTGDVGAGKTTLVRKLLSGLNAGEVVAAQIASTQLGADDLLRSVLKAFGETSQGRSKAEVIAALEAYLTSLSAVGRRALLVVDEAQNLQPEAIEELRMLSNFQWGPKPVLQSFLVGQPELRGKLQLPWMEQLRQRVIASCHLGPLEPAETRAYIEHRLLQVGWTGRPGFEAQTFEQVHRWAQGIPRRINVLCNRLMLAAYLGNVAHIGAQDVARVAADFKAELGDRPAAVGDVAWGGADELSVPVGSVGPTGPTGPFALQPAPAAVDSARPASETASRALVELRRSHGTGVNVVAPIFCVVDTPATRLRCAVLGQAFEAQPDMPPMLVVHPGRACDWRLDETQAAALREPALVAHLEVAAGPYAAYSAEVQLRFAELLRQWAPAAVLLLGRSDATLACALVAVKLDRPVFRIASSGGWWPRDRKSQLNGALLETLTEMRLLEGNVAATARRGPAALAHPVGSLMASALAQLMPVVPPVEQAWLQVVEPAPGAAPLARGFVLVAAEWPEDLRSGGELATLVSTLCELAGQLVVIWPLAEATRQVLCADAALQRLAQAGVSLPRALNTLEALGLLQGAACLVCGHAGTLSEEAEALGLPVVGPSDVMKQAVLAATGLAAAAPAPPVDTVQAGADIVGLLRRWRLRERLAAATGSSSTSESHAVVMSGSVSGSVPGSVPGSVADPAWNT